MFGNILFSDTLFSDVDGETPIPYLQSWIDVCRGHSNFDDVAKTTSTWTEQSINNDSWEDKTPTDIPTVICTRN